MPEDKFFQPPGSKRSEKRVAVSEDLLWGVHPVLAALTERPESVAEVVLVRDRKGKKQQEIYAAVQQHKIRLSLCEAIRLTGDGAAEARHQGVVARLRAVPVVELAALVEKFRLKIAAGEKPRLVACDSLHDPHNLGAIIRSAYAAGACGVLITKDRSAPLSGVVAKAAAGALAAIDVCQVTNLVQALKTMKQAGAWIFGAVKEQASRSLYDTDLRLPAVLVIGGEAEGIRPLVRKECDLLLSIPMAGNLESLNSSVAAAVILFEAWRQNNAS